MNIISSLIVVTGIGIIGLIGYADYSTSQNNEEYKTVCKLNGGIPVHNGRHWDCLGANK